MQVSELKGKLSEAKTTQAKLQTKVDEASMAHKAAEARAAELKGQVEQLQFLLDEKHVKSDTLEQQVSGAHATGCCLPLPRFREA